MKDNLHRLGVVLWPGVAFDLTDEKDVRAAAEWICEAACEAGLIPTAEEAKAMRDKMRKAKVKK